MSPRITSNSADGISIGESPLPGVKLRVICGGHTGAIGRIAWSPCGSFLASPSFDKTVKIWNAQDGSLVRTLVGHTQRVISVAWAPDGKQLASAGDEERIRIWDMESGQLKVKLPRVHTSSVVSLAWSPDGSILASGGWDKLVCVWNIASYQQIVGLHGDGYHVLAVAWAPDGKKLAAVGFMGYPVIWNRANWNRMETWWKPKNSGANSRLYGLAWSPDSNRIYAASADNVVSIFNLSDGAISRLEGHTGHVKSVSCSGDGLLIASKGAVNDNQIRLWRSDSMLPLGAIRESSSHSWRQGLAFHPKLPVLASLGNRETSIRVWDLDVTALLGAKAPNEVVQLTSAKIVLVGESNVGKSYLAHRIATGLPPEKDVIKSTHGMRFWPMESEQLSPEAKSPSDQRREVVLWDMGGQDEYRLIHQLFLHDTTLALVLFDPTRGSTAFREVEAWNKALENQLRGRAAVKLLVGAKLDKSSDTIDQQGVQRLIKDCSFAGFYETSALTGRGVAELCDAASKAIDWGGLGKTSRPELFQRIRDEIESRRRRGEVVLHVAELTRSLSATTWTDEEDAAVNAVTEQLASQGVIARSRVTTGEAVLVLQVQEIERYAGSLIIAAKKNPRGVPALELRAIAQEKFPLPGIPDQERLPREQEKPVLECTVQLMLEHGICFQHEGLLIFPSLFAPALEGADGKLLHAVSLYYDFAGAIDNIYASLVAWLVLAKEFGKVRLSSDRAEFEVKDGGLCGLRKVGRPGGFAHVDVYFEQETAEQQRKEFISFVEDHLARNGVEIREHVAIKCPCNHEFLENTLRQRIARGDKDVVCPVCETRHCLTEGASTSRVRDAKISQHTWALRTRIEKLREKLTMSAVQALGKAEAAKPATGPIRMLHLSDLHFTAATPVTARLQWLLDDIKQDGGLGFQELDYLVISGDFTDKGSLDGFEKAYDFVSGLTQEFGLSAERCIFVPGNHDVRDLEEAYDWKKKPDGLKDGEWVKQGEIYLARNTAKYPLRLKAFSDAFFHKFIQRPYPLDCAAQGTAVPFWETGLQFLTLNSCWQIDEFHRKRSGVNVEAVANAIKEAQNQETAARAAGQLPAGKPLLRIAVWHHAVAGPETMAETDFLTNLQKAGVRVGMHGDVHKLHRDVVGHWHEQGKQLHILGAGSFGSPPEGRPESMPRLYNVIEINRNLTSMRVHTRQQLTADGAWSGWHDWPNPKDGSSKVAHYDINF